jgi:hypothetical protein
VFHIEKASINEAYYEEAPVKTDAKPTETKEGEKTEEKKDEKKTEKAKKEKSTVCILKTAECAYGIPQSVLDVSVNIYI